MLLEQLEYEIFIERKKLHDVGLDSSDLSVVFNYDGACAAKAGKKAQQAFNPRSATVFGFNYSVDVDQIAPFSIITKLTKASSH